MKLAELLARDKVLMIQAQANQFAQTEEIDESLGVGIVAAIRAAMVLGYVRGRRDQIVEQRYGSVT